MDEVCLLDYSCKKQPMNCCCTDRDEKAHGMVSKTVFAIRGDLNTSDYPARVAVCAIARQVVSPANRPECTIQENYAKKEEECAASRNSCGRVLNANAWGFESPHSDILFNNQKIGGLFMENLRLKISNAQKRIKKFEKQMKLSDSQVWAKLIDNELYLIKLYKKRLNK